MLFNNLKYIIDNFLVSGSQTVKCMNIDARCKGTYIFIIILGIKILY